MTLPRREPMESSTYGAPSRAVSMGIITEDIVTISLEKTPGSLTFISINCPDRLGLAFDLARCMSDFGLDIARADFSIDGKWCLLLFWVRSRVGSARTFKWFVLKKRLVACCPSSSTSSLWSPLVTTIKKKEDIYLLHICMKDRVGLLNEAVQALWELDLEVQRVNVMVSPDGRAITLLYLSDCGDTLNNRRRQEIREHVCSLLGDPSAFCEIQPVRADGIIEPAALRSPCGIPDSLFDEMLIGEGPHVSNLSMSIDNSLSPGHTLLQIAFQDRRGFLYDCLRTLKDMRIQVAYGRLSTSDSGSGDLDLFILQEDGTKLCDPDKQNLLLAQLKSGLCGPVRVMVVNKGPDTELLVATPAEQSGRGRPRVLYDVTLVLKMLELSIFKADIGKLCHNQRKWEVCRFLLEEQPGSTLKTSRTRNHIMERVKNVLLR